MSAADYAADLHSKPLADLHHRLGQFAADSTGRIPGSHSQPSRNIADRPLEGLRIYAAVIHTDGLDDFAATAREEMGEERWAQLQREWAA